MTENFLSLLSMREDMREITRTRLAFSLLLILLLSNLSLGADRAPNNVMTQLTQEKLATQTFTLKQAVDHALTNNPDLQIAIERISHAEAQLGIVLSAFYPQVTARASYEDSNNPAQVFSMVVSQREFSADSILDINNPGHRQNFRPEIIGKLSLFAVDKIITKVKPLNWG